MHQTQADAVCQKLAPWNRARLQIDCALRVAAQCEQQRKALAFNLMHDSLKYRLWCAPVRVALEKSDAMPDLVTSDLQIDDVAATQGHRQRPRAQCHLHGKRLVRAVQAGEDRGAHSRSRCTRTLRWSGHRPLVTRRQ